jgi:hypothetical protein
MSWLDRTAIPLYHTTGNHTTYDPMSEAVFQDVMSHLPRNGPPGQEGLTYFVRRDDLLLIFVHTLWSGLGGEGCVETEWLAETLSRHADARHKLVFGHHPVFSVNGFAGAYQRDINPEMGQRFWEILVRHDVLAYVCSHMLAYDVQVHDGVLQILTAGAGTAHRMPEEIEYLHCIQAALDADGLRYQVLDTDGEVREWLQWPWQLPPDESWAPFAPLTPYAARSREPQAELVIFNFAGRLAADGFGEEQTLLCGQAEPDALAAVWIGLKGRDNRLAVLLSPQKGRSPHLWYGPSIPAGEPFSIQLALHNGLGPGGLLWRRDDASPWSSLTGASAWGLERLSWPANWFTGQGPAGPDDRPFRGQDLRITMHREWQSLAF